MFVSLVNTNGIWDHKREVLESGRVLTGRNIELGELVLNYQALSNIHFGYVGTRAGFDPILLQVGAGAAQYRTWANRDPANVGPISTFLDDPFDNWSIRAGIYIANTVPQAQLSRV